MNKVSKELLKVAKEILAFEGEEELAKYLRIIEESTKRWAALNQDILQQQSALDDKIKELEAQKAALELKMNENFPEFDAQTGVSVALKEAQNVLMGAVETGEDIKGFLDKLGTVQQTIKIRASKSQTPQYKAMWEILVSTLNSREQEKFVQDIVAAVKKNMVELNTGFSAMKVAANSWDKEFVALYNERAEKWNETHDKKQQMKLPKASVKNAGAFDFLGNIGSWIKSKFSAFISKMKSLTSNLIKTENKIEKARAGIKSLNDILKKA